MANDRPEDDMTAWRTKTLGSLALASLLLLACDSGGDGMVGERGKDTAEEEVGCQGTSLCAAEACLSECEDGNAMPWDGCTDGGVSEFVVNSYTVGDQVSPSVASLDDGGFVVAWHSNGALSYSSSAST
jgi:hypothetical protein